MKREERSEYTYIKNRSAKIAGAGSLLTIRTNASAEYKKALDKLYTEKGFHPCTIKVDSRMFDDNERIIYVYGNTFTDGEGNERSWTELYTKEEKARFSEALER